jgi:hypothetical protein
MKTLTNTYNGWANYETWNVALWIFNDEKILKSVMWGLEPYFKSGMSLRDLQYVVRKAFHHEEDLEMSSTPDGVWLDDKEIDWSEIKKAVKEYKNG